MANEPPSAQDGLISFYYDRARVGERVAQGDYRGAVGGKWDIFGRIQLQSLINSGLEPHHFLLDIGCGAFRGGAHAVTYLDAAHYFGVDLNPSLIDAGYENEIVPRGLAAKLPRANLACNGDFEFPWDVTFDFALAQSLFTHLPFNFIRYCLARLAPKMRVGGRFYATYFAVPDGEDPMQPRPQGGPRVSHPIRDPYHYKFRDFAYACVELPWRASTVSSEAWPHPRQKTVCFERLTRADGV